MKPIPILRVGYVLELKKPHPCGSSQFRILRVGGDVRIVCTKCGRDMTVNRIKLENAIKISFIVRMASMLAALVLALLLPIFEVVATLIPLIMLRPILMVSELIRKKEETV